MKKAARSAICRRLRIPGSKSESHHACNTGLKSMSTLKSINWALAWRRTFWTSAFFAFLALVIYMAKDMANSQPVVFGVIVMTAVVGAVAFVYARTSKEALLIAVLAVCIDIFLHASYWSSVIDDISTQVLREQSAASARDVVNEKRRARYAASASGKGAAQLSAEIEVLKQDARWSASAQCSNATATASRAFCQDYYRLVAEHAAAKEAANLEQTVFHTTVEAVDLPRNLAKGAIWVADLTGMSVQDATNMLVALMVLFIQSGLAGSLRIGWAPEKPEEARTAEKAFSPISVASAPGQPVLAPRSPMVALEKMTGVKATPKSPALGSEEIGQNVKPDNALTAKTASEEITPPDGPGTPIAKPEAPKVEEVAEDKARNVVSFFRDNGQLPEAQRGKKKGHKPVAKAASWLADVCTQVEGHREKSKDCWKSYQEYCALYGKKELPRNAFSRQLNVLVGQKSGKDRPRNKGGSTFEGIRINPVMAQARRRVA